MIVQIYEIQSPWEAEKCVSLGVNHIGSVVLSSVEWRKPELLEVVKISREVGAKSSLIPLFGDLDQLSRVVDFYKPNYLHLCESLTDSLGNALPASRLIERDASLKERFPALEIMRSIPVPVEVSARGFPTLEIAKFFEPVSTVFLIDTWLGKEPVEGFIGITGRTADKGLSKKLVEQSRLPVILAGGLSPENVYDSIRAVRPAGVDSCTLTNQRDVFGKPVRFQKDLARVKRFVEEARRAHMNFCNS
ncbi:MAG: hypothetical protein C4582_00875 [Desulfobacteraceae bacterium]|jgi:phosphoribosylanthranilate isomerase|nr:MAG: hypothetical protein C4582_00875 [Desulfobacteraceae bacterium]